MRKTKYHYANVQGEPPSPLDYLYTIKIILFRIS